jgi:hypothetical protein
MHPVVTEYQLPQLHCPSCGTVTRAALPLGVPTGAFGPRVQAIVALYTGAYHLSKRTVQSVMEDLCGLPVSLGILTHLEHVTVQALATPVAEAQTYVQTQPVAHVTVARWLKAGQTCSVAKTEGVCREVLKVYDALWTFACGRRRAYKQCDGIFGLLTNAGTLARQLGG